MATKTKTKLPKIVHEFTVDRAKWVNGSNNDSTGDGTAGPSSLLNGEGFMCCLGFLAQSCGIPKKAMKYIGMPSAVSGRGRDKLGKLLADEDGPYGVENMIAAVNDHQAYITPKAREKRLTELFRRQGIKVKFVGKYKAPTKESAQ